MIDDVAIQLLAADLEQASSRCLRQANCSHLPARQPECPEACKSSSLDDSVTVYGPQLAGHIAGVSSS
jgi:hypothetical protein